jgi:hypothetical protein
MECLTCGEKINGAMEMQGTAAKPSPGDLSLCMYCGALAIFTSDGIRKPTPEEAHELADREDVIEAQKFFLKFKEKREAII